MEYNEQFYLCVLFVMKEERENSSLRRGKAAELTEEQIQQQNILRLKGIPVESDALGPEMLDNEPDNAKSKFDAQKYGLEGFLRNLTPLQRGVDPNMLGIDLNAPHKLLHTFSSPWIETSRSEVEPLFPHTASFHTAPPAVPLEQRIQSFNDQTLFFIFYTRPRDGVQELAARELQERNWKYHKELQVWLTKDPASEPRQLGLMAEEGRYIFFDPMNWDYVTKSLTLHYNSLCNLT